MKNQNITISSPVFCICLPPLVSLSLIFSQSTFAFSRSHFLSISTRQQKNTLRGGQQIFFHFTSTFQSIQSHTETEPSSEHHSQQHSYSTAASSHQPETRRLATSRRPPLPALFVRTFVHVSSEISPVAPCRPRTRVAKTTQFVCLVFISGSRRLRTAESAVLHNKRNAACTAYVVP